VLVILSVAALVMVGFVALVIELGRLGTAKHEMNQAADAAALAAGMRLPNQKTGAQSAISVAELNGAEAVEVQYPKARSVSVTCSQALPSLLAGIWGVKTTQVRAACSQTQTDPVTSVTRHLRPLAVHPSTYTLSKSVTLTLAVLPKDAKALAKKTASRYVALSLGGTGATTYVENMEVGYAGTVAVRDTLKTEAKSMAKANRTAIVKDPKTRQALFQQAGRAPYNDDGATYSHPDYPYGDPRIALVAVGSNFGGGVTKRNVDVAGFAAFYVRAVSKDGRQLTGRFLEYSVSPGPATDAGQTDYGLRTCWFVR